eukprot:scaffold1785_cov247-Pinguiococcus_pyrenoidosus.AAC.24
MGLVSRFSLRPSCRSFFKTHGFVRIGRHHACARLASSLSCTGNHRSFPSERSNSCVDGTIAHAMQRPCHYLIVSCIASMISTRSPSSRPHARCWRPPGPARGAATLTKLSFTYLRPIYTQSPRPLTASQRALDPSAVDDRPQTNGGGRP